MVMSTRPAQMMNSADYLELKNKAGDILDKTVNRMAGRAYFNFTLKEIKDIDQIILASAIPDAEVGRGADLYNVMVLKTTVDNSLAFDIVTRDVRETFEYKGEEYYQLKKRIQSYSPCLHRERKNDCLGDVEKQYRTIHRCRIKRS